MSESSSSNSLYNKMSDSEDGVDFQTKFDDLDARIALLTESHRDTRNSLNRVVRAMGDLDAELERFRQFLTDRVLVPVENK